MPINALPHAFWAPEEWGQVLEREMHDSEWVHLIILMEFRQNSRTIVCHLRARALFPLLLVCAAISDHAQTTTWTATGVGDFTIPGNWTGGVPSSTTSAVIANGTSGTPTFVTINSGEIESVFNLQVSPVDYNPNNILEINSGGQLSVFGTTIADEGSIILAAGPSNATLMLNSNVTLTGPLAYVVTLSTTGAGSAVIESSNGSTLTNLTDIQGAGIIGNSGLAVINGGSINANVTGQTLTLNGTGLITNYAVLWATNGGTLRLTNGAVVANYGISEAEFSGSAITLSGGAVFEGGSLRALYGATMGTVGTATLDGSTIGALTLTGNYTTGGGSTTNLLGTIAFNNGNMLVDGTAGTAALSLNGNTTLQGSGAVTLNAVIGGGNAIIEQTGTTGSTLTNKATILGAGDIGDGGLALVNSGTIDANSAGLVLRLNGTGGVANTGLIEAANSGVLQISGTTINNSGGNITSAGSGSIVDLTDNGTIQGGTLNNTAGGTMYTIGAGTLDGSTHGALTINGTYTTGDGATTGVVGTIVNNGTMLVNGATLSLNGNTTLQGTGTVSLQNGLIQQTSTAFVTVATLTNQSTIQGAGIIGNRGGLLGGNEFRHDQCQFRGSNPVSRRLGRDHQHRLIGGQ